MLDLDRSSTRLTLCGGGDEVKVLTVRQPWAWAIIYAGKDVENRTWRPGPKELKTGDRLAIHAAKSLYYHYGDAVRRIFSVSGVIPPPVHDLPLGAIVGTVTYLGVSDYDTSLWADSVDGMNYWRLSKPEVLVPMHCRGRLRIWEVDSDVVAAMGGRVD